RDACCRLPRPDGAEVRQRGEKSIDADRGADGWNPLAEEPHDQIVISSAAEYRSELRRIEKDGLEYRAGVVGQAACDREVERDAIIAVPQSVEVIGNARHRIDLCRRIGHPGE